MKHTFSLALLLLVVSCSYAQSDQWYSYVASYNNKPGSVVVNMALRAQAPDRRNPYLVIVGPQAHNCGRNGLPAQNEFPALDTMLEAVTTFLSGLTPLAHAGTFSYNCERLNYYYVRDTAGVRSSLRRMLDRNYPDYTFTLKIKNDPAWNSYLNSLYPDERTQRWMESGKLMAAMMQMGDSLTAPRNINIKFHFTNETDRDLFARAARSRDFKANNAQTGAEGIYGIVVSKVDAVRMGLIDTMTNDLLTEARKYHGIYINWEAPAHTSRK